MPTRAAPLIKTKSIHSAIEPRRDGLRVLVTRFRGRGLSKTRYDVWMPSLGPSEQLSRDGQSGRMPWAEFKRRYRAELFEDGVIDRRNRTIKNHGQKFTLRLLQVLAKHDQVTLMCHCPEDQPHCHRHILKNILQREKLPAK